MRIVLIALLRGCVWTLVGAASAFAIPRADMQGAAETTANQSIDSSGLAPTGKRDVPLFVIPQSKLLHFDSAIRIPHRYLVKFKDDAALANDIVGSNLSAMKIAPVSVTRDSEEAPKSILVAEDSITARTLLKNILEFAGYKVKTAIDGAEALTVLATEGFDLVVSDVEMPRMDGFALTRAVRSSSRFAHLPVILFTSRGSETDRARGVEVGADAYIIKGSPERRNLLDAVAQLL